MAFLPKLISSLTCPSIVYDDCILFWDINQSKEASIQFKRETRRGCDFRL